MQPQQEADSLLKRELGPGEELLWFNRPDPKRLRRTGPANVFLILIIIFGSIGLVMLITAIILFTTVHNKGGTIAATVLSPISGTFLFVALIYSIFVLVYRKSSRHTMYGITNQRVIILSTGPTLSADSYTRNDIDYITRRERPDNSGDLFFAGRRSPMYTYNNNYGYNNANYGYGYEYGAYGMSNSGSFIGIPDVRNAEQVLREIFKSDH